MLFCEECNIEVKSIASHNRTRKHKENCCIEIDSNIKLVKTCFKNRIATYHISSNTDLTDVKLYLQNKKSKIISLIEKSLEICTSVKVNFELYGLYLLSSLKQHEVKSFNSQYGVVSRNTDFEEFFANYQAIWLKRHRNFRLGSNQTAFSRTPLYSY